MSQIKSKNTKPEMIVRRFLFSKGFRYRLHNSKLSGKPDLYLPKYKSAIFVHGCFWHGHEGCRYFVIPKTRTKWWLDKINSNKQRDIKNLLELSEKKIKVHTIFECQLKPEIKDETLNKLLGKLKGVRR